MVNQGNKVGVAQGRSLPPGATVTASTPAWQWEVRPPVLSPTVSRLGFGKAAAWELPGKGRLKGKVLSASSGPLGWAGHWDKYRLVRPSAHATSLGTGSRPWAGRHSHSHHFPTGKGGPALLPGAGHGCC